MSMLTKKIFQDLARFQSGLCVSVYLPTHRSGLEVLQEEDSLVLKNQLKEITKTIQERGFSEKETKDFLEPLSALLYDRFLWRHQEDGLAIFLADNHFSYFKLPLFFKQYFYVAHGFYLKPLLPYFMGNGDYHLLSLNFQEVRLYQGNKANLNEVHFDPPLPQRLEEVVGYDYQAKFVGYHASKVGGHKQAIFHGHGEWQADEKNEILHFFRAIDKAIAPELNQNIGPLVLATQDYLYPLYAAANSYAQLHPEFLSGNPKLLTRTELHSRSLDLLSSDYEKTRQQQADLLQQLHDTKRTSTEIQAVTPAALAGQIEALFLDKEEEIWGKYQLKNGLVDVQEQQDHANTSLTNLAAVEVFLNGGSVYLLDRKDLPLSFSPVNALFRY